MSLLGSPMDDAFSTIMSSAKKFEDEIRNEIRQEFLEKTNAEMRTEYDCLLIKVENEVTAYWVAEVDRISRLADKYQDMWSSEKRRADQAEKRLENILLAKRARDANRKEARRAYDQQEAERKRTQDPMIRRTLMSDEQRRMDQKVVKLLQKAQSTTEKEAQELRNKALYLVQKYDITIVKKEVLEWLHQPITSAETPSTQLASASLPSSVSSLGE